MAEKWKVKQETLPPHPVVRNGKVAQNQVLVRVWGMRQLCADGGGPGPAMEVPPGSEWRMKALGTSPRSPSARPGPTTAHGMGGSGLTAGGRCREKGRFYDPRGASQEGGRRVGLGAGAAKGALPRTTVSTTAGTG